MTWPDLSSATIKASPRKQYQVTMNSQKRKRFKYWCGRLNKSTTGPLVTAFSPDRSPLESRKGIADTVCASAEAAVYTHTLCWKGETRNGLLPGSVQSSPRIQAWMGDSVASPAR